MSGHSYSKLRWEIIIVILSFSLIPLFALGSFMYLQFTNTYTQKVMSNMRTIANNKKMALDMFFEERISQLKTIAYTHSYKDLSNQQFLRDVFKIVQSSSKSVIDLGIINEDGDQVAYVGTYNLLGLNYKNEEWFHEVVFKELYISDVFLGFRRFPHFIIAVMRKEDEKFWVLRATIDSNIFTSLVQGIQMAQRGDAYLINSENILQTPSRFGTPVMEQSEFPKSAPFSELIVKEEKIKGRNMIVGMTWLENKNWMLVVTQDPTEELLPLLQTQKFVYILVIGGILIILLGTLFVAKNIISELIKSDKEKAALDTHLMQSSKMAALGKMAAGVAHEVNNPLSLIKESAGWLKDLLSEEDPQKIINFEEIDKTVNKIDLHVERAKNVTHRMLGFARRFEPVQESVDLNSLADQTLSFLENEITHRSIVVEKNYSNKIPIINTDTTQLQQVILNVIDNAIDAIDKNGTIKISTGINSNPKEVFLKIIDSGPGMKPDEVNKIFDPFYTTKKVGDGTGLGLSISFSIMEKLGGRIEVESSIGKGSIFTITLPLNS